MIFSVKVGGKRPTNFKFMKDSDMKKRHKKNLKKLAKFLIKGEDLVNFDMGAFCIDNKGFHLAPQKHECGTVACALGHGPAAGIAVIERPAVVSEDGYASAVLRSNVLEWEIYCIENFGIDFAGDEFMFLFDDEWSGYDNTAKGAGHRIMWFLENGAPNMRGKYYIYSIFENGWWK
jgi:hypothetical protein